MSFRNKPPKETTSVWNIKEKQFPKKSKLKSQIKFLVRYAILAPSGHNTQPWKFRIGENFLQILPDWERQREEVDPNNRELFISLGCALKNIEIAARHFGLIFSKEYLIEEEGQKTIINLGFINGTRIAEENQSLFNAIMERTTNRAIFEEKKIDLHLIKKLVKEDKEARVEVKKFLKTGEKKKIAELIYTSNRVWFKSKELVAELNKWLRDDVEGVNDELPTKKYEIRKISSSVKNFAGKDENSVEIKAAKEKEKALTCSAILAITSKEDGIRAWIKCGELFEEVALEATAAGLNLAFFNTVVELKTQREKLAEICGGKLYPQLMFRIGYCKQQAKHSPRRGLNEVIEKL